MKASCVRLVRFVTAVLSAVALTLMGSISANAFGEQFGLSANAEATAAGQGLFTISTPGQATAPVTLTITGGTFTGGTTSEEVTIARPATLARVYTCTGANTTITVSILAIKGGANFAVPAPCGAAVEQPTPVTPVWNQSASIVAGAAGSGLATVTYNNEESSHSGGFYVTINGGAPMYTRVLLTRQSWPFTVTAKPGDVLRVYGTKDGTGQATLLATSDPLPKAAVVVPPPVKKPAPPVVKPLPPIKKPAPAPVKAPVVPAVKPAEVAVAAPVVPAVSSPVAASATTNVVTSAPQAATNYQEVPKLNAWKAPVFDTSVGTDSSQSTIAPAGDRSQNNLWAVLGLFLTIVVMGLASIGALSLSQRRQAK